MLFADGSRLAGNTARRVAGTRTELRRAVYSPCELCAEDPTRPPVWQIEAEQIVDDKELQIIEYRNAVMEIDGFPVFYTPYMSLARPVDQALQRIPRPDPGLRSLERLPDRDSLLPSARPGQGHHLPPDFHHRGRDGARHAIQRALQQRDFGDRRQRHLRQPKHQCRRARRERDQRPARPSLLANGVLDLSDSWRVGLDTQATSDQTYLERYHFTYTTNYLTDHVYAENFGDASYANISAYAFQNLNPSFSIANEPVVLPDANYTLTTPARRAGRAMASHGRHLESDGPERLRRAPPVGRRVVARAVQRTVGRQLRVHRFDARRRLRQRPDPGVRCRTERNRDDGPRVPSGLAQRGAIRGSGRATPSPR